MKLHVYEGGIREPGLLRWKGKIQPGQVSDVPVCSLDLLPTVCELVKIPLPQGKVLDGTSLVPLISGKVIERKKPLFWHYYGGMGNRQVALREGDWKLVAWWDQDSKLASGGSLKPGIVPLLKKSHLAGFELYNLSNDLAESQDLAKKEPAQLKRLSRLAEERYLEVIAEGPDWFGEMSPPASSGND
jgi:arylsulfatase A